MDFWILFGSKAPLEICKDFFFLFIVYPVVFYTRLLRAATIVIMVIRVIGIFTTISLPRLFLLDIS